MTCPKSPRRGATLVEMIVGCALFTVFMMLSVGMFSELTQAVKKEQNPAESLQEGRLAVLRLARHLRNCQSMVQPKIFAFLIQPTDQMMLRDQALGKTVEISLADQRLRETTYPLDYNPLTPGNTTPLKQQILCRAQNLRLESGGYQYPTRVSVELTLLDGRKVRAVTNFREAL